MPVLDAQLARARTAVRPIAGGALLVRGYAVATVGAELLLLLVSPALGVVADAVLFAAALSHRSAHTSRRANALALLALVPLVRLLGLAMPLQSIGRPLWYAVLSTPVLVAIALTGRLVSPSFPSVAPIGAWPRQVGIALGGVPLGLAVWWLARPSDATAGFAWWELGVAATVVGACAVIVDEVAFRGTLRRQARPLLGRYAGRLLAAQAAIIALGLVSLGYAAAVALAAVVLLPAGVRTGSLAGALAGQAIASVVVVVACATL